DWSSDVCSSDLLEPDLRHCAGARLADCIGYVFVSLMENLTACGKKTELPQIRLKADCAIGRARGRLRRESQRGPRGAHIHSLEARSSWCNSGECARPRQG